MSTRGSQSEISSLHPARKTALSLDGALQPSCTPLEDPVLLREEGQPPLTPTRKDPCLRLFPGDDLVWILAILTLRRTFQRQPFGFPSLARASRWIPKWSLPYFHRPVAWAITPTSCRTSSSIEAPYRGNDWLFQSRKTILIKRRKRRFHGWPYSNSKKENWRPLRTHRKRQTRS